MDANEFINWFGNELRDLIQTTSVENRFEPSRDLANRAINTLKEMSSPQLIQVDDLLNASHQTNMVGNFRIPWDIRDDNDTIEEIIATIEGYIEG